MTARDTKENDSIKALVGPQDWWLISVWALHQNSCCFILSADDCIANNYAI